MIIFLPWLNIALHFPKSKTNSIFLIIRLIKIRCWPKDSIEKCKSNQCGRFHIIIYKIYMHINMYSRRFCFFFRFVFFYVRRHPAVHQSKKMHFPSNSNCILSFIFSRDEEQHTRELEVFTKDVSPTRTKLRISSVWMVARRSMAYCIYCREVRTNTFGIWALNA